MAAGAPMDLSVHLGAIPAEQAARSLEWQKVRFRIGAEPCPSSGAAACPPRRRSPWRTFPACGTRCSGEGKALFHASLSVTLARRQRGHPEGPDPEGPGPLRRHAWASWTTWPSGKAEGLLSTLPLGLNAVAVWRTLDTSSLARLFPFSPPDLDTRSGTLYGIDLRACAPIVYDPFDGTHLNANTAVLARSGSGKILSPPSWACCGVCAGECGPTSSTPRASTPTWPAPPVGSVLVPRRPRPGHEPLRHRPGRLGRTLAAHRQPAPLIEVMVGERLSAERRSSLDHALASYYAERRERTGFRDFYAYLQEETPEIAHLLRPFATGSLRDLLSDEGDDLLAREALVTVFDLHLLEPELRPAAAMVCTETVWAAAAQDPRPRLLVVDEVWSSCSTPRAPPSWSRWRSAPASTGWDSSSSPRTCRTSSPRTLQEQSPATPAGRCSRTPPSSCLLQQDAAAVSTVGEAFDLPEELQRWLLSCPRGDGLLLARGQPLSRPHRGHPGGDRGHRVAARTQALNPSSTP